MSRIPPVDRERSSDSSNQRRISVGADLLPRTHWNVNVSYYLDRAFDAMASTLVAQVHLFM
jgi:hypothetical protein